MMIPLTNVRNIIAVAEKKLKYSRTRSSVVSGIADDLIEPMYANGGGDLCEEWNIIFGYMRHMQEPIVLKPITCESDKPICTMQTNYV